MRIALFVGLAALIVLIPITHVQAKKAEKVDICHVNSANDVFDAGPFGVLAFGKVISVSENSVAAHEKHGDSQLFGPVTDDLRDALELFLDISLPNANCLFLVPFVAGFLDTDTLDTIIQVYVVAVRRSRSFFFLCLDTYVLYNQLCLIDIGF